jgi:hypothetical protein
MPVTRSTPAEEGGDPRTTAGPDPKRRKLRKGTHSCWACKRRKEKCTFKPNTPTFPDPAAICSGCQRRDTHCVSQEFPDDFTVAPDSTRQINERVVRVEALVEKLIVRLDGGDGAGSRGDRSGIHTPAPTDDPDSTTHSSRQDQLTAATGSGTSTFEYGRFDSTTHVSIGPGKYARLSQTLYEALPSAQDRDILFRAINPNLYTFNTKMTTRYKVLEQSGTNIPKSMLINFGPDTHPVLIGRHMLRLASTLQKFVHIQGLSESVRNIRERLADVAISLVSTQDGLLGSIEGLECVMLESLYHANVGNLRLSWTAVRRGMNLAQLMGFNLSGRNLRYQILDPTTKADPQTMWTRLVYYDRTLCLMLGLPEGTNDRSMASDANLAADTPYGRLERMHSVLASRILERNASESGSRDFCLTRELDRELQRAAKAVPSKWWLIPDMEGLELDFSRIFWDAKRLSSQIFHYNMLNRLHLPFMLRSSTEHNYYYSKIACVSASREILSRFIVLRKCNTNACSCRTSDFVALMAAMTLLLAYLDSHRRPQQAGSPLAHQRYSDCAMMEQVLNRLEDINHATADFFSTQSIDLLRRLMAIEAEAADGQLARAEGVSVQTDEAGEMLPNDDEDCDGIVRVEIPYFGVIKIAREGTISKENPRSPHPAINAESSKSQLSISKEVTGEPGLQANETGTLKCSQVRNIRPEIIEKTKGDAAGELSSITHDALFPEINPLTYDGNVVQPSPQSHTGLFDPFLPGVTAGADDWIFQGVDMAFFDSLMGNDTNSEQFDADGMIWRDTGT